MYLIYSHSFIKKLIVIHDRIFGTRAHVSLFNDYVAILGFSHSISDLSLFIYHHSIDTAYFLLYIDDIFFTVLFGVLRDSIISKLNSDTI
jgi:hypothetical protein